MRPMAPPNLALLLYTQSPQQEASSGPMDLIPEEEELSSLISMFNKQFNLFFRAREAQKTLTMRRLLSQASLMQEMIIELVGRDNGIRLCQEWIPRDKLHNLEASLMTQNNGQGPPNLMAQIIRPPSQLAIVPNASQQPILATPTPEPTGSQLRELRAVAKEFQVSATTTITAAPREPELPRSSNAAAATTADAPSEAATSFYTAKARIIKLAGTIHPIILTRRKDSQTTTSLILKATGEDQRGTGDAHGTTLRGFYK
ncbi:hypothetical protein PTTG_29444 [Puccinia triticina 1-1 BBBD Race 1]|uniref:Uncharacterized protein n=1 Tax=Puccinia triticina (isolate 1-1 / race 1 (BBBD)) TaxID=630390 RepID=A0A180G490_PUCT1|nr:hypothetical protein PTTG_29444 [Puccinia triticina 1-1 BBBD Race 1]